MIWRQQYLKHLRQDLERWAERGLVDPDKVDAIYKAASERTGPRHMTAILSMLGAILLGFAALSFVAANWAEMSKGLKLAILGVSMWAAFGTALWTGRTSARQQSTAAPLYAEAALLCAIALFGVAIMLIGQMYHVDSDYSEGLLLWTAGALVTAWLAPSRAALAAALVLGTVWSAMALSGLDRPHAEFFIFLAPATLLAVAMGWRWGMRLALTAFIFWCLFTSGWLLDQPDLPNEAVPALGALIGFGAFAKGHLRMKLLAGYDSELAHAGLAGILLAGFFVPIFIEGAPFPPLAYSIAGGVLTAAFFAVAIVAARQGRLGMADAIALEAAAIAVFVFPYLSTTMGEAFMKWAFVVGYFAFSVWSVSYGTRHDDRPAINMGFAAFGAMTLYVYAETVGTLLDTAAFFAIGGLVLIGLAVALARTRRLVIAEDGKEEGAAR